MIRHAKPQTFRHRGLSFLEISIVIGVLMALTVILFVGVRAWRTGSDRANCILNQRTMQMAVRSMQNMYGYRNGSQPNGESVVEALWRREFISRYLLECANGDSACPGGGDYVVANSNQFPPDGQLFMACSLAESRSHAPENVTDW